MKLEEEVIDRLTEGNLAAKLAQAMRIDGERIHWKLWSRPKSRSLNLTIHVAPAVPKTKGLVYAENVKFWKQIRAVLGDRHNQITVNLSDRVSLEFWRGGPWYPHNVLARGGPFGWGSQRGDWGR